MIVFIRYSFWKLVVLSRILCIVEVHLDVREFIKEIPGLMGILGLWIFAKPYRPVEVFIRITLLHLMLKDNNVS